MDRSELNVMLKKKTFQLGRIFDCILGIANEKLFKPRVNEKLSSEGRSNSRQSRHHPSGCTRRKGRHPHFLLDRCYHRLT